jgi:hypothetical protein
MYYQPNGTNGFAFFTPPNGQSLAWAAVGDLLVAAHSETLVTEVVGQEACVQPSI